MQFCHRFGSALVAMGWSGIWCKRADSHVAYRYLNRSSCFDLPGVSNADEYVATRNAMSVVGIPRADQVGCLVVIQSLAVVCATQPVMAVGDRKLSN